jgi:hypothetical protein
VKTLRHCHRANIHQLTLYFVIGHRGRTTFIQGLSVFNTRIGRLWRDVRSQFIDKYARIFNYLESHNLLDPSNPLHLYPLHWVYLPLLRRAAQTWVGMYNHHGMSTKGLKSAPPLGQWYECGSSFLPDHGDPPLTQHLSFPLRRSTRETKWGMHQLLPLGVRRSGRSRMER